jgi:DNA-binding response OmpR family regulator
VKSNRHESEVPVRVLMVEDHWIFAQTVTKQFLTAHEVTVAKTLSEGRALIAGGFDVVLVDYDLPDGKGDALVRELVAQRFAGRIIAISAHDLGNEALLSAGAHVSCPKARLHEIASHL